MNIFDVKKILRYAFLKSIVCITYMLYIFFKRNESLFDSLIMAMYAYSILTALILLYWKTKNVLITIIISVITIVALIKIPFPDTVISLFAFLLLFGGVLYDCYFLVRKFEIKYDETHGKQQKWKELDSLVRKNRKLSQQERYIYTMYETSRSFLDRGIDLARRLKQQIELAEEAWKYTSGNDGNIKELRKEYDEFIYEATPIITYMLSDIAATVTPGDTRQAQEQYEKVRGIYNKFQSIRKNLDEVSKRKGDSTADQTVNANTSTGNFFVGCDSLESLKKRYTDLCKIYHPDTGNGSSEIFIQLQQEYERLKKTF